MNTDPIKCVTDNRRASERYADNSPIKIRRPGSLSSIPGTVIDRSNHGIGMIANSCDHSLMPGSAIELMPTSGFPAPIESASAIRATIAWIVITGQGTRIGVRFQNPQEHTLTEAAAA